tara:strand:+ start:354 stop:971 length:618 start_codon:yes stop_codon:yes gene_type:complete
MKFNKILDFIPNTSTNYVEKILLNTELEIILVNKRKSKYGDFRKHRNGFCQITLNKTQNHYRFLITLIHELSHYFVDKYYNKKVKPHGKEWKFEFRKLMLPLLTEKIFPKEILINLHKYFKNPKASTDSDLELAIELSKYDSIEHNKKFLKDIFINDFFKYGDNRVFKNLGKVRKRYICLDIKSGNKYLFSPITKVKKHYEKSCC